MQLPSPIPNSDATEARSSPSPSRHRLQEARRVVRLALYFALARWLPASTSPAGTVWRATRRAIAAPLLRHSGPEVNIERGAYFGRGDRVSLGTRSGLGVNCQLHGPVTIGDDVMMGPDVMIFAEAHAFGDTSRPMIDQGFSDSREVVIEDDVWIGARAIILPGVRVGRGSIVGAGAVVSRDVPPFAVMAGNPAREVRNRVDTVSGPEHGVPDER